MCMTRDDVKHRIVVYISNVWLFSCWIDVPSYSRFILLVLVELLNRIQHSMQYTSFCSSEGWLWSCINWNCCRFTFYNVFAVRLFIVYLFAFSLINNIILLFNTAFYHCVFYIYVYTTCGIYVYIQLYLHLLYF